MLHFPHRHQIRKRQCMVSYFFLLKQFKDCNIYLDSIKSYMGMDDRFNWNYGLSLISCEKYSKAEDVLLTVSDESIKLDDDGLYYQWLARCFIMNGRPEKAWDTFIQLKSLLKSKWETGKKKDKDNPDDGTEDDEGKQGANCNKLCIILLLKLIANDCYRMNLFLISARAFSNLEDCFDKSVNTLEERGNEKDHSDRIDCVRGKRGACVGEFQRLLEKRLGNETKSSNFYQYKENISELIDILRRPKRDSHSERIVGTMMNYINF